MKTFIIHNNKCFNVVIVEAKDKKDALQKARKIMVELNKFENFTLGNVHEIKRMQGKLKENKNKSFIYRNTDNVIDVFVQN